MSHYVTLFHHHSPSFVIFRDINLDGFSQTITKVGFFLTDKFITLKKNSKSKLKKISMRNHEKPSNIAIFCESSRTMVVTICQFPPYLTKIRESSRVNSLGRALSCHYLTFPFQRICYSKSKLMA